MKFRAVRMTSKFLLSAAIAASFFPASAFGGGSGFFAGLDATGGIASGSSTTRNGGAAIAGGGVVDNVKFGGAFGVGGHIGYRFSPVLSAFVSYQHVRGDVRWDADFPLWGVASSFNGTAIGNVILGNIAHDLALSDTTSIRSSLGLGLSFNSLSGIVETDKPTGGFLAEVADHTRISPAVQIGAGIQHKISPNAVIGMDVSASYTGGFETGNTRTGNLGVTSIGPYKIDDVWRANLGASLRVTF